MKYRDLEINFSIENVAFQAISISIEKLEQAIPMHSHSKNSYEIHYISFGYGTLRCEEKTYDIVPGTLFVTGPEVEHEQISVVSDPMTEYCIYLKVRPESKSVKGTLVESFLKNVFWFGTGDTGYHEWMKQIVSELEHRPLGYKLVLQSLLQQVILYLTRKYNASNDFSQSDSESSKSNGVNDLTYLIIEEAFLYNYKDITLKSLSSQIGLGTRQTERLLKLHYHKTFQQKKTEARMSAASSLLRDTTQSVSDIAFSLGYSSVEHFSSAFKQSMGCTPSNYRHKH